jgi:DNA-binding response OmpR family regulator
MSGAELQARLLLEGHRLPIIFVTAFPEENIRERVLRNGAIGYLIKPLEERCLIACLDQAFRPGRISPDKNRAFTPWTASYSIPAYRGPISFYGIWLRSYSGAIDLIVLAFAQEEERETQQRGCGRVRDARNGAIYGSHCSANHQSH